MKENPDNLKHIEIIKAGPFGEKGLKIIYRLKKGHPFIRPEEVISLLEKKYPDYRFSQHYGSKGEYIAILSRRKVRKNPAPKTVEPIRVDVWEERDRLVITAYDGKDREIATWSDEDARQMFEDGFFRIRDVEQSVAEYVREMGLRPRRKDAKNPTAGDIHIDIASHNPPVRLTEIYRDILEIRAVKKDGRRYVHKFRKGSSIFGLPDGSILVRSRKGKRLWKNFD